MVVIRLPGHRWFGDPQPAQAYASEDLPYAWLSTAVYGSPTSTKPDEKARFTEGKAALGDQWSMWPDFPNADLQAKMDHLRAQVWKANEELRQLQRHVIAEGGISASRYLGRNASLDRITSERAVGAEPPFEFCDLLLKIPGAECAKKWSAGCLT